MKYFLVTIRLSLNDMESCCITGIVQADDFIDFAENCNKPSKGLEDYNISILYSKEITLNAYCKYRNYDKYCKYIIFNKREFNVNCIFKNLSKIIPEN